MCRKAARLMSASGAVLLTALLMPGAGWAADYTVANETELRNAITAANGSADASSTITLSGNIALSSTAAFPASTKPLTINTNGFNLSGFDRPSGNFNGGSIFFSGGPTIVNSGDIRGGNAFSSTSTVDGVGGTGLTLTNGSMVNKGTITGGTGGDNPGATGGSGTGGLGVALTGGSHINDGTIMGGVGGLLLANGVRNGGGGVTITNASLTNNGTIQAGDSVAGGTSNPGIQVVGTVSLTNHGTIRGGTGPTNTNPIRGVAINVPSGANATIVNTGTIEAGKGGAAIYGIFGLGAANLTVINSGTIRSGGPGAAAITFDNDATATATLELRAGSVIDGLVLADVAKTNDIFRLGGDSNSSFDVSTLGPTAQYQGFNLFQKTGASTWTLTGSTTQVTAWDLQGGTLSISSNGNLGGAAGGVTFNGGTLRNTAAFTTARTMTLTGAGNFQTDADLTLTGTITGAGALNKTGSAALILNGTNSYTGVTNVQAGALVVGDAAHTGATLASSNTVNIGSDGTFGGYGTYTGTINNGGTVAAANAIASLAGSGTGTFTVNGTLNNAGIINLGGTGIGNQLVVAGSYVGQNGLIRMNARLDGDGAPSDQLVLDGGTASGTTRLQINNVGGAGAPVVQNGIQVITAQNGATSPTSAFNLAAPVKSGIYQYYLAKGGVTAGTSENWYLRNFIPAAGGAGTPIPAGGILLPSSGSEPVPLYRPEVPLYREIAGVSRMLGIEQINTFHEREGRPSQEQETGRPTHAWARVWGSDANLEMSGLTSPKFDGSFYGIQAGHDLYETQSGNGDRDRFGAFFSYARADGDVHGFVVGTPNAKAGTLSVESYGIGGYWTHQSSSGWYTDTVLMGNSMTIDPSAQDGDSASTHGYALVGSVEAGLPLTLANGLVVEPQGQVLYQRLSLNNVTESGSHMEFDGGDSFTTRIGVRLSGKTGAASEWQPYLKLNLLRSFGRHDAVTFDDTTVTSSIGQTSGQVGVGVTGKIGRTSSMYAALSYQTNLDGEEQRITSGNVGVQFVW
jgi:outer membrane autotransporter protein